MPIYELTAAAEADLVGIIDYTLERYGVAQTQKYVADLEHCAKKLANGQGHYRELKDIHPYLRVVHCQHHYIFGLIQTPKPMAVVAILHERMNLVERLRARLQ